MKTFYLKVVACDKVFFDGECTSLTIPLNDGSKGILPGHEDTVMAIESGEMCISVENAEPIHAFVGSGFIEMLDGEATVIVISCEKPEDIDVKRAKEAMERAREELRQKQSMREYYHSTASLARAMERLKLKKKYNKI